MEPLTREQIVTQLADFIIATLESATRMPARKWALFQEIRGVLTYAATLDDYLRLDVMEEVWVQANLSSEAVYGMWKAYNA